jgi:hypothetical protein
MGKNQQYVCDYDIFQLFLEQGFPSTYVSTRDRKCQEFGGYMHVLSKC